MATRIWKGGSFFFKPFIREKSNATLTALAGGGQTGATLLNAGINLITTVASAADSCILPATVAGSGGAPASARGSVITVVNLGANATNIYPATGDKIDGLAANTAISLPVNTIANFACGSANNWYATYSGFGGVTAQSQRNVAANPGSISSSTMQMCGLAGTITPVVTGRVEITITGDVTQSTTADGAKWQISYGTGGAPANAAALTGTQVGPNPTMTFLTGVLTIPFSISAIATGLTRGTAYWVDLALAMVTGGAANVSNVGISVVEF